MLGNNKNIIGDADSLIALVNKEDSNHKKAIEIVHKLAKGGYTIIYPNTAILEAMTALKRKLSMDNKAQLIAKQFLDGDLNILWVDEGISKEAIRVLTANSKSKQNTVFDCVIVACARKIVADGIFSFDRWYLKLGFTLAEKLVVE